MFITKFPTEITTEIASYLDLNDLKSCILTNHSWYDQFKLYVFRSLHIKSRRLFKQLFLKMTEDKQFGGHIRILKLDQNVGISNEEFKQLPVLCPFMEYIEFNPYLWRYFGYSDNLLQWQYVYRYPSMEKPRLTLPILKVNGRSLTYLEISSVLVDEIGDTSYTIFSLLQLTPCLTSLILHDGIVKSQPTSIRELELIHHYCPRLKLLSLNSFELLHTEGVDMNALTLSTHLRSLSINALINHEQILSYWGHKYPYLESLHLQLGLIEPSTFRDIILPENTNMKNQWTSLATYWPHLNRLTGSFDEKYFPLDLFLRGVMNNHQMKELSICFLDFDYHRRSSLRFKQLLTNSKNTLASANILNWDQSWSLKSDLLGPLGQCRLLESLSLSPQPGLLTEFDIDILLDQCKGLKKLELSNTYNLFVKDDTVQDEHPLQEFVLQYTMANDRMFDYIARRCPHLSKLHILHVTKPYDNNITLNIHMPHHRFHSLHVEGLKLGLRLEDSGFQSNCSSTLCSLSIGNDDQRWYHLYQPKEKGTKLAPRLQRLSTDQIQSIHQTKVTDRLWTQVAAAGNRFRYEYKHNWTLDIPYGVSSIQCASVNEFKFEGILVHN